MQSKEMMTVDYEVDDGIAYIFLNRPHKLNALIFQMAEDLCEALDEAGRDGARAVILAGRGRAFCAGHDLSHEENYADEIQLRRHLQRVQDVTRKIRRAPCAVVAAVHGYALGAGCGFALCSDLIVAARDAQFGFPEVSVGQSVTGGISHVLPAAVGSARAKELVLLGESFGAERAARLGLINRVVDREELEKAALGLARKLRDQPRAALARAKIALDRGSQSGIEDAFELEANHAAATAYSEEAAQAAEAFRRSKAERDGKKP